MTRDQAISLIEEQLLRLDDGQISALAEIARSMEERFRPLSPQEQQRLKAARDDFAAGRTMSHDELIAALDASPALARLPKIRS